MQVGEKSQGGDDSRKTIRDTTCLFIQVHGKVLKEEHLVLLSFFKIVIRFFGLTQIRQH